jgi:hypothetical protein
MQLQFGGCPFVFDQFQVDVFLIKYKQKNVQFIVIYHLVAHGHPNMTNYENLKDLCFNP